MKPIDRNALFLVPATTLVVISLLRLSNSLAPATLSNLSNASNQTSFILALILTVVALVSGFGLAFRTRLGYLGSVSAATLLLGFSCYEFIGLLQRTPKMNADVSASLMIGASVQIFFFIAILVLLLLPATRERCFPHDSEQGDAGKPDPVPS